MLLLCNYLRSYSLPCRICDINVHSISISNTKHYTYSAVSFPKLVMELMLTSPCCVDRCKVVEIVEPVLAVWWRHCHWSLLRMTSTGKHKLYMHKNQNNKYYSYNLMIWFDFISKCCWIGPDWQSTQSRVINQWILSCIRKIQKHCQYTEASCEVPPEYLQYLLKTVVKKSTSSNLTSY